MPSTTEQTTTEQIDTLSPKSRKSGTWLGALMLSPLLWGGLLTYGFYRLIPYLPAQRELADRYFCSHPLEYATATLFFVGMAILGLKAVKLRAEKASLAGDPLADTEMTATADPLKRVDQIGQRLFALPNRLHRTKLIQRIRDACLHVRGRQSAERLEEHLKYLAELAADSLHQSYALVRTITWAVPILGFLGTVIGITIAIANVTPEQLDSSLGEVTSGLAIAFDTTALALALSLVLVFSSFLVERLEQRILAEVEEFGIKRITSLFPSSTESNDPLAQAQINAAEKLVEKTESLINWQMQLWQESLESLRHRWTETLDTQKQEFDAALQEGMAATLTDHAQQLTDVRHEFLQAFQHVSDQLAEGMAESREAQAKLLDGFNRQIDAIWNQITTDLSASREDQASRNESLIQSISEMVTEWQTQLQASTAAGTSQLEELHRQGDVLLQIVQQEEHLATLQARLVDNLEAVRAAETFEETLHSLSAAVHLLTARTRPSAA